MDKREHLKDCYYNLSDTIKYVNSYIVYDGINNDVLELVDLVGLILTWDIEDIDKSKLMEFERIFKIKADNTDNIQLVKLEKMFKTTIKDIKKIIKRNKKRFYFTDGKEYLDVKITSEGKIKEDFIL